MGYDRVFLTPDEDKWLRDNGAALSPVYRTLSPLSSLVEHFQAGAVKAALVHFPLLDHQAVPSDQVKDAVRREIAAQREKADLVIGMSHWGRVHEATFLSEGAPGLDILIGGGPGPMDADTIANNGKTLWSRSGVKGRTLAIIRVYQLPKDIPRWKLDDSIQAQGVNLEGSVADDPFVKALFHPVANATAPGK